MTASRVPSIAGPGRRLRNSRAEHAGSAGAVERAEAAALGNGVDRGFRGVVGVCPWGWKAPQWAARVRV